MVAGPDFIVCINQRRVALFTTCSLQSTDRRKKIESVLAAAAYTPMQHIQFNRQ
jgi:pectin methylesterase-like acyl-CoA thioesterase